MYRETTVRPQSLHRVTCYRYVINSYELIYNPSFLTLLYETPPRSQVSLLNGGGWRFMATISCNKLCLTVMAPSIQLIPAAESSVARHITVYTLMYAALH
ncbi:hypothetical protein J6590_021070 [Homalodisca vitripennis]|nr:hypothetical protein J6590_021070 [Homalodisca vitripennis]